MQMKSFMLINTERFILQDHVKIIHWKNNFIGRRIKRFFSFELFWIIIDGIQQILNVYRVINPVVMRMRNLVLEMEVIIY
jgi:hypothetical protein